MGREQGQGAEQESGQGMVEEEGREDAALSRRVEWACWGRT